MIEKYLEGVYRKVLLFIAALSIYGALNKDQHLKDIDFDILLLIFFALLATYFAFRDEEQS